MKYGFGILLALVFITLSSLHMYWGIQQKTTGGAVIPTDASGKPLFSPSRLDCFTVALVLAAFAFFVLIKAGIINVSLPGWLLRYGTWGLALIFILRAVGDFKYIGFSKRIKETAFARSDSTFYSPLCIGIAVLLILLELL